jgi:hypothetical protein
MIQFSVAPTVKLAVFSTGAPRLNEPTDTFEVADIEDRVIAPEELIEAPVSAKDPAVTVPDVEIELLLISPVRVSVVPVKGPELETPPAHVIDPVVSTKLPLLTVMPAVVVTAPVIAKVPAVAAIAGVTTEVVALAVPAT